MKNKFKAKISTFIFSLLIFNFSFNCYAKNITILFTGETHSMLYPCSCPVQADGGISRRAAMIKELRKKNPNLLLLDSGGFFGAGVMDEYLQNTELDKERTKINLKAIELMKYDALNIGDDEFNFGRGFLEENISNTKIPYLSSNIISQKIKPYIIKEIDGVKVGIIGLSGKFTEPKAGGLKFINPEIAVKNMVQELKSKNVNIVILLSHQGEADDSSLLNSVEGIDVLVVGHSRLKEDLISKIGSVLIVRPSWQGRRLIKLSLVIKDSKISDYKTEDLRLSDKIKDDEAIISFLPRCFSDFNCKKKGFNALCQNPGTLNARCSFTEAAKINLTVITPKQCRACNPQAVIDELKKLFSGVSVSYLYYPDAAAARAVDEFKIKNLPAYLLDKKIENEKGFEEFKKNLKDIGQYYELNEEYTGIAYFLSRKKIDGKIDLFISLYDKDTGALLDLVRKYNPLVHFLAVEQKNGFDAAKGNLEVEDYLRGVCVQKYYPQQFYNYITCRAKNINSSWWQDCANNLDQGKIVACARSPEGQGLLRGNISLNKEIQAMIGPVYLVDNVEVFGTRGLPTEGELKKLLKK